jgi:NitT/TauT family transport system ATP-binding protein
MTHIQIDRLQIAYRLAERDIVAVNGMNMSVNEREFVCVLGPSGCGKSTTLMAIAGLIQISDGSITIDGTPVNGPNPECAVVFQEFALMPWLTVKANVRFGLRLKGVARRIQEEKARHYIDMVGLSAFEDAYPHQLSGGMRQRVGIARALAVNPSILLMDEPFGALDAQTREIMGMELLKIWDQERKTVVFVTHGIDEAISLADRVIVMNGRPGRIRSEIKVEIPRPRDQRIHKMAEFAELREQIWDLLQSPSAEPAQSR